MSDLSPRRWKRVLCRQYRLGRYLREPGDGRLRPSIPAGVLLWSQVVGNLLRDGAFHGVESLVRSGRRQALGIARGFGDDALVYFTERLDPGPTRRALVTLVSQAKRNKAFQRAPFIGLALDGTGLSRCARAGCSLCHPPTGDHQTYGHYASMISVVGTGLSLPLDLEPYPPGDSESAASQRLLKRAVGSLGRRFADYVVADGAYASAPFLHLAGSLGLRAVVRLKGNLPQLFAAAQAAFEARPPSMTFGWGRDRVEAWDAEDFDPWDALSWKTVRVLRYRQRKPDGTLHEAYWLTDWPRQEVDTQRLFQMAKSRWEIENQGFNVAKNLYGMEHICHHQENSLLVTWLLTLFTVTMERLIRLRYLKRGTHRPYSAIEFVRLVRLTLGRPALNDSG